MKRGLAMSCVDAGLPTRLRREHTSRSAAANALSVVTLRSDLTPEEGRSYRAGWVFNDEVGTMGSVRFGSVRFGSVRFGPEGRFGAYVLMGLLSAAACGDDRGPDDNVSWAEDEPIPPKGSDLTERPRPVAAGASENKITTNNNGAAYVQECRDAGVEVPDRVLDTRVGWQVAASRIETLFMEPDLEDALLWTLRTANDTVCMALPRAHSGQNADVIGLICMAHDGTTCYFTNPTDFTFPTTDTDGFDIGNLIGGTDLEDTELNLEGVCSDCHAGENPFIVHPEDPGFTGLLPTLDGLDRPSQWATPIVPASYPGNPQPIDHLGPVGSGQGRCDQGACHSDAASVRFPLVSTDYPGYCKQVLEPAVGQVKGVPNTMPPSHTGQNIADYADHVDWLLAACDTRPGAGTVVRYIPPPLEVLPPDVEAPYECSSFVRVTNAVYGATVALSVDGQPAGTGEFTDPIAGHVFQLADPLIGPETLSVTQSVDGKTSIATLVFVRDHTKDYPNGLPAPTIWPTPLYECASSIAVVNVPGVELEVRRVNPDLSSNTVTLETGAGHTWVSGLGGSIATGTTFEARQTLCTDVSPWSAEVETIQAPATLPELVFAPPELVAGQPLVQFESIVQGSRVLVDETTIPDVIYDNPSVPYESWFANVTDVLGGPLLSSHMVSGTQTLCGASTTTDRFTPHSCSGSNLVPEIAPPQAGDDFVLVTYAVPGSTVRVLDTGDVEIGNGSSDVIGLTRDLVAGEVIYVVAELPDCTVNQAFSIAVSG